MPSSFWSRLVPVFALRLDRPHCFLMDFQAENARPPPGTPESPASTKKGGSPGVSSSGSEKPRCKLVDCSEVKKTGTAFCAGHSNSVRSMRNSAAAKDKKFKVTRFTEEFDLRMTSPAGWRAHHIVQHLACLCVGGGRLEYIIAVHRVDESMRWWLAGRRWVGNCPAQRRRRQVLSSLPVCRTS
jgi:hypothetical protein